MTDSDTADHGTPGRGTAGRDAALVAMRPAIATADPDRAATAAEAFLHRTLRPVLKLQNGTLLALVAAHVGGLVKGFAAFAPDDRRERLGALLRTDSRLKRTLVGVVLGALTSGELAFAMEHEAEVRRRIVALVAERVAGQEGTVAALCADAARQAR